MKKKQKGITLKRIHYSWVICIGCTLLMFCTSGLALTGFAAYLPYMVSLKGLANVQISTIVFFRSLFGAVSMLFVNSALRRFEIRKVVTMALVGSGAAFLAYGIADGFAGYCVSAAIAGTAYGFGGMIPVSILISRWFNEHRGLALGICMASTGVSTFIASPVITILVENLSLQMSFFIEAGLILAAAIIVFMLLRSMPSCLNMEPLGVEANNCTQIYAERTAPGPLLFAMAAGWLLLGAAANNLHSHLSVLYQSVGFDSGRISTVISLFGISLAIGKCAYGQLSDKMGVFRACTILYVISLIGSGLCCMARIGNFYIACIAAMLVGFGMAVATVATSTYASEIATEEDYPKLVSCFQTSQTLGGLVFATIPGLLADITGDYIPAYAIMFLFILVSTALLQGIFLIIQKGKKRR